MPELPPPPLLPRLVSAQFRGMMFDFSPHLGTAAPGRLLAPCLGPFSPTLSPFRALLTLILRDYALSRPAQALLCKEAVVFSAVKPYSEVTNHLCCCWYFRPHRTPPPASPPLPRAYQPLEVEVSSWALT